jgi:hypothetical protein
MLKDLDESSQLAALKSTFERDHPHLAEWNAVLPEAICEFLNAGQFCGRSVLVSAAVESSEHRFESRRVRGEIY